MDPPSGRVKLMEHGVGLQPYAWVGFKRKENYLVLPSRFFKIMPFCFLSRFVFWHISPALEF